MFPSHSAEQSAVAFQLAAALEHYEAGIDRLVARGYDPELYADLSRQFEQMRLYASSLPELSVAWVAFLISRFELTHAMWKAPRTPGATQVASAHSEHKEAIATVRRVCARKFTRH